MGILVRLTPHLDVCLAIGAQGLGEGTEDAPLPSPRAALPPSLAAALAEEAKGGGEGGTQVSGHIYHGTQGVHWTFYPHYQISIVYVTIGRSDQMVGPTGLREHIVRDFDVRLYATEVASLFNFFLPPQDKSQVRPRSRIRSLVYIC
jgi:hypothetical protein